ncbi:astacin-like metalloendopeptidase [Eleutherodactylus coqui]|uniref:astacin-like metalloendopeptidase n=1 Tax=Eleutherodactylus coqui TaxID=57060 RepID=UPI0034631D6B
MEASKYFTILSYLLRVGLSLPYQASPGIDSQSVAYVKLVQPAIAESVLSLQHVVKQGVCDTIRQLLKQDPVSELQSPERILPAEIGKSLGLCRWSTIFVFAEADEIEEDISSIIFKQNKGSKKLIHHGDIAVRPGRSALSCPGQACLWPKSSSGVVIVPYKLSSDYSSADSAVIRSAIQEYTSLTCIRFVERKTEMDYIQIRPVDGCWSYLGKIGGPQELSLLSLGCVSKGIVQHELNHVLGFVHEHTRSDRDAYVDIIWPYILAGHVNNFVKSIPETNNLALQYDYTSVMHYGKYAFTTVPGHPTIVPKPNATVPVGQRYGLSSLDLMKINHLYQCDVCSFLLCKLSGTFHSRYTNSASQKRAGCVWLIRVPTNKVYLQFHAFSTSSACSTDRMIVYNGASKSSPVLLNTTCRTGKPPPVVSTANLMLVQFWNKEKTRFSASYHTVDCGGTFSSVSGTVTTPGFPTKYFPSTHCKWSIMAPPGYKIQLSFTSFALEFSRNCMYDYLSILHGSRINSAVTETFCGSKKMPTRLSKGNWVLLEFHTDKSVQSTGFQVKYKWVR